MEGGGEGGLGVNLIKRKCGTVVNIGGKATTNLGVGDMLMILTPGGGGYGVEGEREKQEDKGVDETTGGFEGVGNGSLRGYEDMQFSA